MSKISVFNEEWFPEIAGLVKGLNDTQIRAVEYLVTKEPSDTWNTVAKRVGISERQLRNIRNDGQVQEVCYQISKRLFRGDMPDVLKVLSKKAKAGNAWAVKLFLEVNGELAEDKAVQRGSLSHLEVSERATKVLESMTLDELTDRLLEKVSEVPPSFQIVARK